MKIKKYAVQATAYTVFRISVYSVATLIAFNLVFSDPSSIKGAFTDVRAYERFVPLTIDAAAAAQAPGAVSALDDPQVRAIIEQSFPAIELQKNTETVIDSTYRWLRGETPQPDFVVDFTPNIDMLAQKLSTYGMQRLQAQPVCTQAPATIDPFTSACRPAQFDYAAEQFALENAIREQNGILSQTRFTVDNLPKTTDGRELVDAYAYVPTLYGVAQWLPYVLGATMVVSGVLAVVLDRKRRIAVRRVGWSIVWANVFLILSPILYFYVFPRLFPGMSVDRSAAGGGLVFNDVLRVLSTEFSYQVVLIGSLLVVIGVMMIVLERATRPVSRYVGADRKAGLQSSEKPKQKRGKVAVAADTVPLQTSEGKRRKSYKKSKRYRTISRKEYE